MWQKFVAGGLLIAIAVAIGLFVSRLPEKKDKIVAILTLLASICVLILTTFFSPLPPDYVPLNRPWLDPVLIISQFKEGSFRASYEITNLGKLPAVECRFAFVGPSMRSFDPCLLTPRNIAPGGKISYVPNPLRFEMKRINRYNHFTLAIEYHSQVGNVKRAFRSIFDVGLYRDELQEGSYRPLSTPTQKARSQIKTSRSSSDFRHPLRSDNVHAKRANTSFTYLGSYADSRIACRLISWQLPRGFENMKPSSGNT